MLGMRTIGPRTGLLVVLALAVSGGCACGTRGSLGDLATDSGTGGDSGGAGDNGDGAGTDTDTATGGGDRDHARNAGAIGFLAKPFPEASLLELISLARETCLVQEK